jgi:hypothetical protein
MFQWLKHVGVKDKIQNIEQLNKCAFVGLCMNNKFTLIHSVEQIKFINAQQTQCVYKYKSTKEKLLEMNNAIWFNKMCKANHLTPIYVCVCVHTHTSQWMATTHKMRRVLEDFIMHLMQFLLYFCIPIVGHPEEDTGMTETCRCKE